MPPFIPGLIFLSFLLFMGSCRQGGQTTSEREMAKKMLSQAEVLITLAPDSVIHFTDSALQGAVSLPVKDPLILQLNLIRAEALIHQRRFEEAIAILEPLHYRMHDVAETSFDFQSAFLLGKAFLSIGKLKLANTFLREAYSFPDEAAKLGELATMDALLGKLSILRGDHSQAMEHFLRASLIEDSIANQKRVQGLLRYQAASSLGMGDTARSMTLLEEAISQAGQERDSIEWMKCLHAQAFALASQAPERASASYEQAIDLMATHRADPESDLVSLDYALFLAERNQDRNALELLNRQMDNARARQDGALLLATALRMSAIHEELGKLDQALSWLDTAELYVQHATRIGTLHEMQDRRARVLRRQGQPEKAYLTLEARNQRIDSVTLKILDEATLEMDRVYRNEREGIQHDLLEARLDREITLQRLLLGTLLALSLVALILGLLLKQRHELNQHLGNAYNVLMAKYRSGNDMGNIFPRRNRMTGPPEASAGTNMEDSGILEKLLAYFNQEKPYLDPKFRVETAATKLQVSQKQLSQAIRHSEAGSFNTLVNRFRVEESRKLMEDPELANYKVEFIGYKAGFGTKQTFYTAFEQNTGITPGYYRNNIQAKVGSDA